MQTKFNQQLKCIKNDINISDLIGSIGQVQVYEI